MASGGSSLDSTGSNGTLSRSYTVSNNDRSNSSGVASVRDYDGLKQQCDKAMHELQLLRRQHSETIRRCDHTMKELEYYRGQHLAAMNQLEAAAQESSTLRHKYSDLAAEKQRLDREVQNLQKEVTELRCQQQEVIVSEGGTNDSLNQQYFNALRKYEAVKDEYDALRKRYDDLLSSHSTAVSKLELAQEEVGRFKKQYEEVVQERNAAVRERNGLKQQCTAAIRQWDMALRERNEYREALAKVQQQHEEAVKEINQAMAVRMKASKDLKRLTEERNAAMQEYSLIMSERDTVHKEMEKLSEDLTEAFKKYKTLEGENKECMEKKKALSYQVETLKREIASALHDRDRALKECNDLREKFGGYTVKDDSNREGYKSRLEYHTYSRERDNTRKDQAEVSTSTRDMYGKSQKERMDNLDQANIEIDRLRKQIDKLQAELQEATQEAEVSKRRRDWAFSERDKIVLERESIRTLCDRLRKERDRAVSDLAEALRDSDDIKKQRNEASKELKDLKEKMEAEQEKETRMQQFHAMGHNHSHDSAIDADMQEWETEILDIDLSGLASDDDLGFDLVGGRDDPQYPNDSGIYVSSITKGSVADGKLKVHDCISRVNNLDCSNVSKRMVVETVRSSGGIASMVVRRRRIGGRCLYTTQLQLNMTDHGLTLETGIYICKITPGSVAAKEGNLAVGDRVLSINNKTMDGFKSALEAMAILDEPTDIITITTLKALSSVNCSHSCGHMLSIEEERGYFGSSNSSSRALKESPSNAQKMVNRCCQTEGEKLYVTNPSQGEDFVSDRRYINTTFGIGEKAVYKVTPSPVEKGGNSRAWDMVRETIDMVRGRKHAKDRNHDLPDEKKHRQNQSPNTFEREQDDALAELDSVIESYHGKPVTLKRSRRRAGKDAERNGGTWPKARNGPIIEHTTGTILHPRRHKERLPLAALLNDPPKYCCPPADTSHERTASCTAGSSNYKANSPDNANIHYSKSSQLLSGQKSFTPAPFKEILCEKNDRIRGPSDASIDLSVKSGNVGKEVMEYYVKKKKYPPSDSEDSHSRIHSQLYGAVRSYPFNPYPVAHHHPHPHTESTANRYPSPTLLPSSQSGESIGMTDMRSYCFEPSYAPPSQGFHHTHSPSVDLPYKPRPVLPAHSHPGYRGNDDMNIGYSCCEGGTFPRKKENQRIRIPSNPSVTSKSSAGKVSTGSIERASDRGSPMPTFLVEVLSPGHRENKRNSLPDYCYSRKPAPGELRRVHIDKSAEPLGIQISCLESGGVFVSTVSEHSLASQVGLQVGDQLLEVCGINMRSATYQLAASVLRQCGNSITMLVQYSPDKYHELEGSVSSSSDESPSHSGSPTPCNSPDTTRKPTPLQLGELPPSAICNLRSGTTPSGHGTLTRSKIAQAVSSLTRQNATTRSPDDANKIPVREPRYLFLETRKSSHLGVSLVGGNAVGIFVHGVQPDSVAHNAGLRTGDQILEYNGTDLQHATAEEAAYELAKPADKVTILAQYNIDRYNEIRDKPGDSFYIRAMFDRMGDMGDQHQLQFHKDDVLYVDNTMFNGVPGHWRAWFVGEDGHMQQCGIIPSKYKVDEELLLRRSVGDLEGDARRGTTSARRSFFRRKKHQRSSSRDSKELASFSNINLGWYSDSGTLNEEVALCSYQRVERLDYPVFRPVLIMGPLADCVMEKLIQDFPDKFTRCIPEVMQCPQSVMEKGIAENLFVDYRKKGSYFECTSVNAVKEICDKNTHCILDISLTSVERLHRHQIYPIVLLIKFKSTKQIKEVKDTRYPMEKVSAKAAKEMYEHALKLEVEYRHLISAVIPAGVNVAYMCTQIKAAVDQEQNKTLWVPCGTL
ncbi:disks large homolog 5 [Schistocerca americana]|uniref:disks large homolog 5 n=1 Tax=Schistocerca americana TaxID=7009 RepID=UPI001F4FC5E2|nr:disks large homolog 5 [Schistocerca americana]XP_049949210.1 disks large homolog 5-like [Schistocerca serialis cubense]